MDVLKKAGFKKIHIHQVSRKNVQVKFKDGVKEFDIFTLDGSDAKEEWILPSEIVRVRFIKVKTMVADAFSKYNNEYTTLKQIPSPLYTYLTSKTVVPLLIENDFIKLADYAEIILRHGIRSNLGLNGCEYEDTLLVETEDIAEIFS